jgi:hypothetical protein
LWLGFELVSWSVEQFSLPYIFGVLSQKEVTQIFKDVFEASKPKHHGKAYLLLFNLEKLAKLGKVYDLDVRVQVIEEGGERKEQAQQKGLLFFSGEGDDSSNRVGGIHGMHSGSGHEADNDRPSINEERKGQESTDNNDPISTLTLVNSNPINNIPNYIDNNSVSQQP